MCDIVNIKGNIGIAIVVALVAIFSGISLAAIAFRDTVAFSNQLDGIQQFHYIRSEVGRGRLAASHLETMDNPARDNLLPIKRRRVEFNRFRTVYRARTRVSIRDERGEKSFLIRTLLAGVRGRDDTQAPELQSQSKRYAENRIRSLQSLAVFHYFSDIDEERNAVPGNIRFYAGDIVHGRVHSNTDIWIRQNSWPRFYDLVSTSGQIRVYPGGGTVYPKEHIFRGGLIENYQRIVFDPTANAVRRNASTPFGTHENDEKIAFVTIEGTAFRSKIGEISINSPSSESDWIEEVNQFTVYDSYPPYGPVGNEIGVNRIAMPDTVWREGPTGTASGGSNWVPMELWISGQVTGSQTWASSHEIFIKDDITYTNTQPGLRPDGLNESGETTLPVNPTDYFGLISEESIWIQYGHNCPEDSIRRRPNTNSIYMYGAYCAVGQGTETWEDGIVSFQYQFPKGSTPDQYWDSGPMRVDRNARQGSSTPDQYRGDRKYTKIDLHRFHYPTTLQQPWPLGLDYPWYNPLWPEPGNVFGVPAIPNPDNRPRVVRLRGNIWLFGSIAQRRRGYVRRSGTPSFDTGLWDIDNSIDPDSPPRYGAPPPNLGPAGYDKRYHFDKRFERHSPPDFPLIIFEGYDSDELRDLGFLTLRWEFKSPPSNF